jgi:flagellin
MTLGGTGDDGKTDGVIFAINAQTTATGVTASQKDGRLVLTSADGKAVNLSNPETTDGKGALAKVGLSAGTTQAQLTADTSVSLNGIEVKFKKRRLDGRHRVLDKQCKHRRNCQQKC